MKLANLFLSIFLLQLTVLFFSSCDSATNSKAGADPAAISSDQGMMEAENPSEYGTCSVCGGSGNTSGCASCGNKGWERCNRCGGSGDDGSGNVGCEKCFSTGKATCNHCQGAGSDYVSNCAKCNGTGETTFIDCPLCEGGKIVKNGESLDCWMCDGSSGKIEGR
jgi:hypothetical protein